MKPQCGRSYGSIPHLFCSQANGDKFVGTGQHRIATEKLRDSKDLVIVQEKLDGANVGVLKLDGVLIPLSRNGHRCEDATYPQLRLFHQWVMQHYDNFDWLQEGERLCGEWLILAHGTKYALKTPFIAFDLMGPCGRLPFHEFMGRLPLYFTPPATLHVGGPLSTTDAMQLLGTFGYHGALEETEGAVWRVERDGKIDFLAKFLRRPPSTTGRYLDDEIYNVDINKFRGELPWTIE